MDPEARELATAVARRPSLWATVARAGMLHRPRRWWSRDTVQRTTPWLRFRMETAYGTERAVPTGSDAVTWLRWLRAWPSVRR